MVSYVYQLLLEKQDLEYKKFHSSLCPGISNIIGVRVPKVRKIVKNLLKQDYKEYLNNVKNVYYEETLIEGLLIAQGNIPLEDKLNYLDKFVPKIDNWAICDMVSSSFKLKKSEDLQRMWKYLLKYKDSNKEFELRFMIVMFLDYYLIDDYIKEVLEIIDSIISKDYYVKMAIAWLISVAFVKDKELILEYLKKNHLDNWIYQKSLQKIIESNRVSSEDKEMIRRMKGVKINCSIRRVII